MLLSIGTGLSTASAAQWPNLPTSNVQLKVVDGTNSYFIATLSDVQAGYSVHNGVYQAWCIDRTENMERNVNHGVTLYSSITPPSSLSSIQWGAINYILNHKQGTMLDVQNAIWHFTNLNSDLTQATQNMISAAQATWVIIH